VTDRGGAEHAIGAALRELADPVRAAREKRYLKSELTHLGVPVPAIRKIVIASARGLDRDRTLALTADLWREPVHELRMAAVEVLIRNVRLLEAGDLDVAERMIRESHTWAYVDALAVKVAGTLVTSDLALATTLDRWADDQDFWIRRSALLALLPGIRAGDSGGDLGRLSAYGDALIEEREFFVRKALGWVLRELSKVNPDWVAGWVRARVDRVSGVTLREAVRHLAEHERAELLTAYRSR
jgi:3-methyladenine DNA glycosylase AlkD